MENLATRLEKIGWNNQDIVKAIGIIRNAKQNNSKDIKFLDKRIYWILLVIIIAANFAISIALIPILIGLQGTLLYFIIITLGIVFGLLFELVIRSIENLEKKHHILLSVMIPVTALVNIFIISKISNEIISDLRIKNFHVPLIIGLIYATSFVLPYVIYRFIFKIEYYAKG